ncbi:MAG: hypothetical protein ACM3JD_18160 [Rudaea sp.]
MSAPYRISRPAVRSYDVGAAAGGENFKSYLDRLMKMIPGEAVGLYLVGSGFIPKEAPAVLAAWAVICLAGVVALKAFGTSDAQAHVPVDWVHVAISAIAFIIWVYSIGGPFAAYSLAVPYIGSLLVLAWTFFVPIFYRGPIE